MLTREKIHEIIDRYFDENKWGEKIPIVNGGISVEVKIENGKAAMVVSDKRREFLVEK